MADSELETVPQEISSNEKIQKKAQERGKKVTELILDSNFHHEPMRNLQDSGRRGRPDIIHICTIAALDSPLNKEGLLRFYVHTRNDKILDVKPETRIPRSYNRFIGLMEQLFSVGKVPPTGEPLIEIQEMTLSQKLENIQARKIFTLSKEGEKIDRRKIFGEVDNGEDICVIVGGFPKGDFLSEVKDLSDHVINIYPKSLNAITAMMHIIQFYEEEAGVV